VYQRYILAGGRSCMQQQYGLPLPAVKFLHNVQCKVDPGRQPSGSKENIVALDEPAATLQLNV
jgi:hypothetical protein